MSELSAAANEVERLAALHRLDLIDSAPDPGLDRIVALAAHVCAVPVAVITLVDHDRIWFLARHGTELRETERAPGLCSSAIRFTGTYLIEDALSDPETQHNPLVTCSFGLRFYAATPLRTADGHALGTLSCIDFEPRQMAAHQLRTLEMLGRLVVDRIELRAAEGAASARAQSLQSQQAHDPLTGAWHARALPDLLNQAHARGMRDGRAFGVMLLDVDYFKQVSAEYGQPMGDQVLRTVVERLRDTLRGGDAIARVGDERFACVLENCSIESARLVAERCRAAVAGLPVTIDHDGPSLTLVSVSIGLIMVHHNAELPSAELLGHAEALLEQSRLEGRNRVTVGVLAPS